ncbi:DUF6525 family protein [Tabrizicola sp. J26]|uniref:DUF6525 family protein n=1 Tax=Alitabrizicola rongguiensis TaxID=2909234 RepID=UPI001F2C31EF|nr:DUF6525 family protein [Tabrizicola rongguiensis]MCF1707825.1 DUF6525 family protein [Tabrizicola rongguiensis]
MTRNLRSALPVRYRAGGMAAYDRLPPELRRWLAAAALPWSVQSALRIWQRARAEGRDPVQMLTRAEQKTLARDRLAAPAP